MLVYADSECDGHDGSSGKAAGNVHMLSAEIGYLRHGREESIFKFVYQKTVQRNKIVAIIQTQGH